MQWYTVVKGDTLWNIARRFYGDPYKYRLIASINGIRNPNLIYVGQRLLIRPGGVSSSPSKPKPTPAPTPAQPKPKPPEPNIVTIDHFGLQANTDRSVFATWSWSKANTKEYKAKWWYDTGNGVWFVGSDSTTTEKQSIYSAPSNATRVMFQAMPISTTHKVNDKDVSYWTGQWSSAKTYSFSSNPPGVPGGLSVELDGYKLTAEVTDVDANTNKVQFQVVKDNATVFKTGTANVTTGMASFSCTVNAGSRYKVRVRGEKNGVYSAWSDYSNNYETIPAASSGITNLKALSATSIYIEWAKATSAETYDIQYTTKVIYFDSSSEVKSTSVDATVNHAEITGLESGQEYFFRVRAKNSHGESAWTPVKSVIIGKKPSAPTTWSSTTTAIVGETLNLYWMHNSEDNSNEKYAELEITIDGSTETKTIQNTRPEEQQDEPQVYSINTSGFAEGVTILWRVRTAGITLQYGDWSVQRTVDIYAPPTLEIKLTDADSVSITTLTTFPFYIYGLAGPATQTPIGYYVNISANETYDTVDSIGNPITISKGDNVYSKYFDISDSLLVEFTPGNVDLANNISYTIDVTVSMNSGLTDSASLQFDVAWNEASFPPNAEISIDKEVLSAYIHPFCTYYPVENYKVVYDSATNTYMETTERLADDLEGTSIDDTLKDDSFIFKTEDGVYFTQKEATTPAFFDNVTLSVYRREFDGGFTEIAKGLVNGSNTFVTDPHPSLDYARYRIVSTVTTTGSVSYYDVPGIPIEHQGIVIQWDEEWSWFDATEEAAMEQPPWSGSMLKLPYNVDITYSHDPDSELVEYIGRKNPVGYYGTQLGSSATWKCDIEKEDTETLYAIRRLSVWMGDVYVRESSGTGYWANIKVDYDRSHNDVIIPVTFNVRRVEGGI